MRQMPLAGARPPLGVGEERAPWAPLSLPPHPRYEGAGPVGHSLQVRSRHLRAGTRNRLLAHRGLNPRYRTSSEAADVLDRIEEGGYLRGVFEGQTFERSGPWAYSRPPLPPYPPTALWSRRGRALRGPGPWRFEWRDSASPSRLTRHRYDPGVRRGPHVSSEGLPHRARPRDVPGLSSYAPAHPPRPEPTSRLGRWVRGALEMPEEASAPHTPVAPPSLEPPTVLLRGHVGRLLPPTREWALSPSLTPGGAEDPAWF